MIKRIISLTMVILTSFLILPVKSYAVAAGTGIIVGGTAYAAGTYTFGTLPPTVQGIINSTAEDYKNQLFPSRSNIVLLDPKNGVGGGGNNNNNKQPTTPPTMWAVITTLIVNAVYEIKEVGDDAYELLVDIIQDEFSDYQPTVAELEVAKDIVQRSVDCVNKTDFGNKPLSCLGFSTYSNENAFEILDNAGLMDNGKEFLGDLKSSDPNIKSITYYDFSTFDFTINQTQFGDYQCMYSFCYVDGSSIKSLYSQELKWGPSIVHLYVEGNVFHIISTNATTGKEVYKNDISLSFAPQYIILFELYKNDFSKIFNYKVKDGDLTSFPGINAPIESDIEKAAKALADQLGVDVSRILDEYKVIIDENGNKYLESTAGIRTAIEDLVKAYNESISGNTAIINNLQKLLDQLKAQDITGLESIVSQIETNIDDLNNRDKNREEVYSNITETLTQVKAQLEKNYIDPEVINNINNNIEAISSVIAPLSDPFKIDQDKLKSPSIITTKFPFSLPFDLYNILTLFVRTPEKPIFTIPINTSLDSFGLDYQVDEELVLDLTMFKIGDVDIVQVVLNFSCIVGFIIMLIKITTKLFV